MSSFWMITVLKFYCLASPLTHLKNHFSASNFFESENFKKLLVKTFHPFEKVHTSGLWILSAFCHL